MPQDDFVARLRDVDHPEAIPRRIGEKLLEIGVELELPMLHRETRSSGAPLQRKRSLDGDVGSHVVAPEGERAVSRVRE
ncbi:MAG TPA: hypothetical protein VLM85_31680 [Polyangiaceae bacterium]|nr:hypothetical protein [Polyangiaceae bacterium]